MLSDDCPKTLSKKGLVKVRPRKVRRLPCISSLIGTLLLPDTGRTLEVWVLDLSSRGAGFMTSEKIGVGQEVVIALKRSKAISTIPLAAKISHCTTEGGCYFRTGCQFSEPIDSGLLEYLVG
jgi:PilZ domain